MINPFSVPLNNEEILILGGIEYSEPKVQIYDTKTDLLSSVAITGAFEFFNDPAGANYSIAQSGHNKVVALVTRLPERKPCLIQFTKETSSITILRDEF